MHLREHVLIRKKLTDVTYVLREGGNQALVSAIMKRYPTELL